MSEEHRRGRPRGHKDLQLCRQVADAIAWFLLDVDDPILSELALASVTPAPTAARVLVTLFGGDGLDREAARTAIAAHAEELREDVAAEICRRRVPELCFRVATASELALD